jgi:DNA-binding transcriptional MerR regulator
MGADALMTISVAAAYYGVSAHHLRLAADRGLVPHQRSGRLRLFAGRDREQVRRVLIENGMIVAGQPAEGVAHGG